MLSRSSREFLEHVAQTRDWKTHLAYENDLKQFEDWLKSKKLTVERADDAAVKKYLAHLERKVGRTMWSTHRAATSIRQLYSYLEQPLAKGIYKVERSEGGLSSTRRALTLKQINRLFAEVKDDSPTSIRDRALFMLLYGLGFVVKDVLDLSLDQVALSEHLIRPFGKSGNKKMTPRVVPLGGQVFNAMDEWLGADGRPAFELNRGARMDRKAVFVGVTGKRLTRQGLTHILKQYASKAGIDDAISPIWLRDSFTKHMKDAGADPEDIDQINGSIAFVGTARNTRSYVEHARKVLNQYHPYWN